MIYKNVLTSTYYESRLSPGQESDSAAVHQQVVTDGPLHQLAENITVYTSDDMEDY